MRAIEHSMQYNAIHFSFFFFFLKKEVNSSIYLGRWRRYFCIAPHRQRQVNGSVQVKLPWLERHDTGEEAGSVVKSIQRSSLGRNNSSKKRKENTH